MSGGGLIEQGVDLMLFGMGTVFVFLSVLVLVTVLMSMIIRRWLPEDDLDRLSSAKRHVVVDDRILSIINAALAKHRSRR